MFTSAFCYRTYTSLCLLVEEFVNLLKCMRGHLIVRLSSTPSYFSKNNTVLAVEIQVDPLSWIMPPVCQVTVCICMCIECYTSEFVGYCLFYSMRSIYVKMKVYPCRIAMCWCVSICIYSSGHSVCLETEGHVCSISTIYVLVLPSTCMLPH